MKDTDCKCEDSSGWTTVKCCNLCGKSVEPFWKVPDNIDLMKELLDDIEMNLDDWCRTPLAMATKFRDKKFI